MSVLTDRQKKFLELVSQESWFTDNFYLGGGTALAEFYLQHRYSKDLDFFCENEFDTSAINVFLVNAKRILQFKNIDSQTSFNRNLFFLNFEDEVLKTEFTYYPFPRIKPTSTGNSMPIDSVIDIAVNKVFTIYQQPRSRDYIDLYCIIKKEGWTLSELVKKAKIKFDWHIDPVQLGTQLYKVTDVKDYPRMIKKIKPQIWQEFFIAEAKKLKKDILS